MAPRPCACGCRKLFSPGEVGTKFIRGHNNKARRKPLNRCETCGEITGTGRARNVRQCKACYLKNTNLVEWVRTHPEEHRLSAAANARSGHAKLNVPSAPVRRALLAKGIRYQDIARDFGISKEYARHLLMGRARHERMRRTMAERLLRYAAGLPYLPTKQQATAAKRKEWQERKGRERSGVEPPERAFERRWDGLAKQTEHLKDPDTMRKRVRGGSGGGAL